MVTVASLLIVPLIGNAQLITATADDLVSYWNCDEASGVRYDSVVSSANDLTDNNTVGVRTAVLGDNACDFNNANSEYLSISDANDVDVSFQDASWTWNAWVVWDSAASFPGLFDATDGSTNGFRCYVNSGWYQCQGDPGNTNIDFNFNTSSYVTADIGNWVMTTITWDSDLAKLYLDGTLVQTLDPSNGAMSDNSTATLFGALSGPGNYMNGGIDEMSYWNIVLDSTDIGLLYNSGSGLGYADLFGSTGTTSTSTATTTDSIDVSSLLWTLELYLSLFSFLIFTYIGYKFTKLFI